MVAIAVLFACFAAQAETRLALLIGNQDYAAKVGPLKNPLHDIELVGASLAKLGFAVTKLPNANKAQMDEAIRRYADQLRRAGPDAIGFFYYSGHGAANPETNVNYLIPVDLDSADSDALWYRSVEQPFVIELLSQRARNATHFVVFDACRNELNLSGEAAKALGADKGFVPVGDVSGILIAHATAPKRTAADTGQFARILSEELTKPGVEAFQVFREVQLRAKEAMKQEPWMSLNYIPRLYLAGKAVEPAPQPAPLAQPIPPLSEAAEAWRILRESGSEAELEAFIKRFGETIFGDFARARLAGVQRTKPPAGPVAEGQPAAPKLHYENASERLVRTFAGHDEGVYSVVFSGDGGKALSGGKGGSLTLWDVANGREIRSLTAHAGTAVWSVAISADARYGLSGGGDHKLKFWDLSSGREIRTLDGHKDTVLSVAMTPDGKFGLSSALTPDYDVRLWDLSTGRCLKIVTHYTNTAWAVAITPDGRFGLSGSSSEKELRLSNLSTGQDTLILKGHQDWVRAVALTPDARYGFSGSTDKTLKLWDLSNGQEIRSFIGHTAEVRSVAITSDGKFGLSGGADKAVKLWSLSSGQELHTFTGHTAAVASVALSPDGRFALSGSEDKTMKLWDISEWTHPQEARR
jgi:hypothetical protein